MKYYDFLKSKVSKIKDTGFDIKIDELNPMLFDYQKDIVKWCLKKGKSAIWADCGLGKGQPYYSKVLTDKGWVNIQDLKIGDKTIASDGKPYDVKGVYPKGEMKTYRFHFSDGNSFVVDEDHLHILRTNNDRQRGKDWRVLSTKEILELDNIRYGKDNNSRNYDIPVVKPIDFESVNHMLSPYIIGSLLGDGGLSTRSGISFTNSDIEIIDRMSNELPEGITIEHRIDSTYAIKSGLYGTDKSPLRMEINRLGLKEGYSHTKFIPSEYKIDSLNNRLSLLQGLMDTDGYISKEGTCQYYTTSDQLADDVIELIQSLGGIPTRSIKTGILNGVKYRDCHIITFSLNTYNPFHVTRKRDRYNENPRANGRWIDRVEFEKVQRTVCISVDSPDSSYVTENHIVTHNTFMQLEYAKQVNIKTGGNVLLVAPLAVVNQTVKEGIKLGIDVNVCRKQEDVIEGLNITNYEMLEHFDADKFIGIVLDESSILKSFTGKYRTLIIDMFKDTKYKLSCTATPAPNDFMELGSHAEFTGVMSRVEMLSTFFVHDSGDTSKWRLKGHASHEFWEWIAKWAVVLEKPSDLGYSDEGFTLPKLNIHEIVVPSNYKSDTFIPYIANTMQERRQARKDSLDKRVEKAAELANSNDEQWTIWCDLNAESDALNKSILGSVEVKGSDKGQHKIDTAAGFADGNIRCIVSKPKIFGWGLNWQHCNNMIFTGLSDSYEQFYQAVRRCWRFGQKEEVNVYVVISESEGAVKRNIERKQRDSNEMMSEMVKHTHKILTESIHGTVNETIEYNPQIEMKLPGWLKGDVK